MITETLHIRGNLPNLGGRVAHNMTFQRESHMEALEPRTPIVHPKTQLRIGNWIVRTLYAQGRTAQAAKAMREASEQVRRRRRRFIGHILRQQPDNDCVTALTWTPEGRRKRGRPKTAWRRTVEKKRSTAGWQSWSEVHTAAQDRNRWKAYVEALCATLAPGDK